MCSGKECRCGGGRGVDRVGGTTVLLQGASP